MPGRVVHVEMPARDADRVQRFYESLFDWKFEAMGGPIDYRIADLGDQQGAAVYAAESGQRGPIVYFDVDDIDAGRTRVRELGGQAEEKAPVPGFGWFAACTDPEGNSFSLWQSDPSAGPS